MEHFRTFPQQAGNHRALKIDQKTVTLRRERQKCENEQTIKNEQRFVFLFVCLFVCLFVGIKVIRSQRELLLEVVIT